MLCSGRLRYSEIRYVAGKTPIHRHSVIHINGCALHRLTLLKQRCGYSQTAMVPQCARRRLNFFSATRHLAIRGALLIAL